MLIAGRHNDEMAVYYAGGAVLQLPIENQQAWLDCSDLAEKWRTYVRGPDYAGLSTAFSRNAPVAPCASHPFCGQENGQAAAEGADRCVNRFSTALQSTFEKNASIYFARSAGL